MSRIQTKAEKAAVKASETLDQAKEAIIETIIAKMEEVMEPAATANVPAQAPAQPMQVLNIAGQTTALNQIGEIAFFFAKCSNGMEIEANVTPDKNGFYSFSFSSKAVR